MLLPWVSHVLSGHDGKIAWAVDLSAHWQWLYLAALAWIAWLHRSGTSVATTSLGAMTLRVGFWLALAVAVVCFVVVHELVARGRETSLRSSLRWMR